MLLQPAAIFANSCFDIGGAANPSVQLRSMGDGLLQEELRLWAVHGTARGHRVLLCRSTAYCCAALVLLLSVVNVLCWVSVLHPDFLFHHSLTLWQRELLKHLFPNYCISEVKVSDGSDNCGERGEGKNATFFWASEPHVT